MLFQGMRHSPFRDELISAGVLAEGFFVSKGGAYE